MAAWAVTFIDSMCSAVGYMGSRWQIQRVDYDAALHLERCGSMKEDSDTWIGPQPPFPVYMTASEMRGAAETLRSSNCSVLFYESLRAFSRGFAGKVR